jgi:hypothetical protein
MYIYMGVKDFPNKNYREKWNMVDVHYLFISFMVCGIIKQRSELSELLLWSYIFWLVYCSFLSQECTESLGRKWKVGILNYISCFCISTVCVLDVMTSSKCSYCWLHESIKHKRNCKEFVERMKCQQKIAKCIFRRRISFVILLLVNIKLRSFGMWWQVACLPTALVCTVMHHLMTGTFWEMRR